MRTESISARRKKCGIILDKYFYPKFKEKILVGSQEFIDKSYERYKKHELNKRRKDIAYVYIKDNLLD